MRLLCSIIMCLLFVGRVSADTLYVAAASDLVFCLEKLNHQFQQQYPQLQIKLATGSSGNFYAQIQQDAPFEVYLSADIRYPQKLIEQQKADANSLFVYAQGQLALWTNNPNVDVAQGLAVLSNSHIKRIAIANPDHAPYGQAARAVLVGQQLWDTLNPKLVMGENIAQTLQFIQSQHAAVGSYQIVDASAEIIEKIEVGAGAFCAEGFFCVDIHDEVQIVEDPVSCIDTAREIAPDVGCVGEFKIVALIVQFCS